MAAVDWTAEHGDELVGMAEDDAAARVRSAGLVPRSVAPGAIVTLEFRPDRVALHLDAAGTVTAVRAG